MIRMIKYRFEILQCPELLDTVNQLMRKFDLISDGIALNEVMTFSSDKEAPLEEIKKLIIQAYEQAGCTVIRIQGGKVE